MSSPRLDTSFVDFESDKGVRSPRTPTYGPDSPSTSSAPPFDPTKYFTQPSRGDDDDDDDDQQPMPLPPPPRQQPIPWVWICHLCHSRYPLGVTRRCLVDGHYYCSGQTNRPSLRKKKKGRACSSEFDYLAWKNWGAWRRGILRVLQNDMVARGCELCDFPSQCRYPPNSHPLADVQATLAFPNAPVREPLSEAEAKATEIKGKGGGKSKANESVDFDQILENIYSNTMPQICSIKRQDKSVTGSKKKPSGKTSTISDEELAEEETRLRELIGPDLWSCLEDVGLDNPPTR